MTLGGLDGKAAGLGEVRRPKTPSGCRAPCPAAPGMADTLAALSPGPRRAEDPSEGPVGCSAQAWYPDVASIFLPAGPGSQGTPLCSLPLAEQAVAGDSQPGWGVGDAGSVFFFGLIALYFWPRWVFTAARRLSLIVLSEVYPSLWCEGVSLWWHLLLLSTGCTLEG